MQSDFNHIDDFFRKKEEEAGADNSMQDMHWQQMKAMMAGHAPMAKIRTLNPKMLWQLLIGSAFIAVIGLLVWRNVGNDNEVNEGNYQKPVVATKEKNSQPNFTGQENTMAANADSQKANKLLVWKPGPFSFTFPVNNFDLGPLHNEVRSNQDILINIPASAITALSQTQLTSFFDELKKTEQEFIIDTERDTTIFCRENTSIFIPARSFRDQNDIVSGNIRFNVGEFYEMADIIGNKLQTSSDDRQLITGGMLNLTASVDGKKLNLVPGASLRVQMPTGKFDPRMQLFYGSQVTPEMPGSPDHGRDSVAYPGSVNWTAAGQQQGYLDTKMIISVIDLLNDPRSINKIRGKKVAKFILSDNSRLSEETVKQELQKRYGNLYDEIKVRRGWKPVEETKGNATNSAKYSNINKMAVISVPMVNNEMRDTISTILTNWKSFKNGLVGDSIRMTLGDAVNAGLITKEDAEKYRTQFKNTTGSDNVDDYLELNRNYRFNVSNLGWINCDKFLAYSKDELTNFVVDAGSDYSQIYFQAFIVFDNFKSVMSGNWYNGKIVFNNIPINEKVNVVCVGIKFGKAVYSIKETTVTKETLTGLQFHETNPAEFREKMKMFGNVQKG